MDVIKTFNQELSSLYDNEPPISKMKIIAISNTGIQAINFYKHVVQSVEKFIMKCHPEYKVPALYVIDSLVRQSRHQFQEKDVFGPRFARNLKSTFQHLYQVSPEDKSKIIRVLNMWQKNEVFTPDIIHPLFDMADPNHPLYRELPEIQARNGVERSSKVEFKTSHGLTSKNEYKLLPSVGKESNQTDLLQHLQCLLQNQHSKKNAKGKFEKKLLDFDFSTKEKEEKTNQTAADALGSILNNPEVLKQLEALQNQTHSKFQKIDFESLQQEHDNEDQKMALQKKEFDKYMDGTLPKLSLASGCQFTSNDVTLSNYVFEHLNLQRTSTFPSIDLTESPPGYSKNDQTDYNERVPQFVQTTCSSNVQSQQQQPVVIDLDEIDSGSDSDKRFYHSYQGKRSHRSWSTSRSSRHRRSRSYNGDGEEKSEIYFDKEKEAERIKKFLPPLKENHLSICSTTLWIGHLSKLVREEELSDTFEEYGDVVSINYIIPRGCAFVCMNRRQDAARALYKLKNTKLQGKTINLAWSPGKGMKDKEWKDFWEVQDGVCYIPYCRLSKDMDYDYLEDGGVFDKDTVPLWLKDHLKTIRNKQKAKSQVELETAIVSSTRGDVTPPAESSCKNTGFILPPDAAPMPFPLPSPSPSVVPAVSIVTPQPGTVTHPLMLPFRLPQLLDPMITAGMTPTGLIPNVPIRMPPFDLYNVHQQLMSRVTSANLPGDVVNQNLDEFQQDILSLPFGLRHLQSTLQQPCTATKTVNQSYKDQTTHEKPATDPLLNLFGTPFPHLGGQFPPNISVAPSSIPTVPIILQNLSVPPPDIKKYEKLDHGIIMECTETKSEDREEIDHREYDRCGGYKENRNDKYRDNDRYREREDRWGSTLIQSCTPTTMDQSIKDQTKPATDPLLNVFGVQFPPNMSVPPPSTPNMPTILLDMTVPPPSTPNLRTMTNLGVPPPDVKKDEELEYDVVMEDTEDEFEDREEKKGGREYIRRCGYNKNRNDNRNHHNKYRNDKYRDIDRYRKKRQNRYVREDKWGRNSNSKGGKNQSSKRNYRTGNNRSFPQDQYSTPFLANDDNNNNNDVIPRNKLKCNQNNKNMESNNYNDSKQREEHLGQLPANYNGPFNSGPGLLRTPPLFVRPPGPHVLGPNRPIPARDRYDGSGANNRKNQDNIDNFEGVPLEHHSRGPPRRDDSDNFPPRGPPFGISRPPEDNFLSGSPGFNPQAFLPPFIKTQPRPLMNNHPEPWSRAVAPFRPRIPIKLFGMRNIVPPLPLGAIPATFRFQRQGPSGGKINKRVEINTGGSRNVLNDQTDSNWLDNAQPRPKRFRCEENSEVLS